MESSQRRRRVEPTDEWEQIELLCGWPEQRDYELIRPMVLFGTPADGRPQETGEKSTWPTTRPSESSAATSDTGVAPAACSDSTRRASSSRPPNARECTRRTAGASSSRYGRISTLSVAPSRGRPVLDLRGKRPGPPTGRSYTKATHRRRQATAGLRSARALHGFWLGLHPGCGPLVFSASLCPAMRPTHYGEVSDVVWSSGS